MLQLTIPPRELYDDNLNEFITFKGQGLNLEHSLVSLSKWESKWCQPFLDRDHKTTEETIDYIRCMTLTQNVDPEVYRYLTRENLREVDDYIKAPMTATVISNSKKATGRSIVTSELIYYWMVTLTIPFECQKWHLNRLLTLINVCVMKNQPADKMTKQQIYERNKALNESRRQALNTKG